jgi:hypothetical protein
MILIQELIFITQKKTITDVKNKKNIRDSFTILDVVRSVSEPNIILLLYTIADAALPAPL